MKQYLISLSLFLFFLSACGNVAVAYPATVTASPYATPWITYTPSPYPTSTASTNILTPALPQQLPATPFGSTDKKPPTCTFPLVGTTTEESKSENYVFSVPRVVLTDPNAGFYIFEWTPDSQQALIIRDVIKDHYEHYQSIELFNPRTIKLHVYAKRPPGEFIYNSPPLWLAGLGAVVFDESTFLSASYDSNGVMVPDSVVNRRLLWLSQGDPAHAQALEDATLTGTDSSRASKTFSSVAVNPDGNDIVYMRSDGKLLYRRKVFRDSIATVQLLPFDLTQWNLSPYSYMTAWRPGSSQILFYSNDSFSYHNFLLDDGTGEICELNFDGTVYLARWSPNGRYLAVIKSVGPMLPLWQVYDMSVLDTATGKLYPIDVTKLNPPAGTPCCTDIIGDFAWGPDNRHLAVIGSAVSFGTSPPAPRTFLYLVDFLSEKIDSLFPSIQFYSAWWGTSLAWSPDGSKVLALCPGLCLITVQKTEQ